MTDNLKQIFNQEKIKFKENESLSVHTTIGIGGPARYFVEVDSIPQLLKTFDVIKTNNLNYFILGGGSNLIISDKGYNGLVIKPKFLTFDIKNKSTLPLFDTYKMTQKRYESQEVSAYRTDFPNSWNDSTLFEIVEIGSSWKLNNLIPHCLKNHLTGLEWFSGIPGSVGGAVYMNIHGGEYFFSQFITQVKTVSPDGLQKTYTSHDLGFDYDKSIFHNLKECITTVYLKLFKGDLNKAENIRQEWGTKKILNQPQKSAGCIWQNLTPQQQKQLNLPVPSIGYCIDKLLSLKGKKLNGACISTLHAGFIQNCKNASAQDVLTLVELVEKEFKEKLNITLLREVEFIGDFS
jgi:UDP-N-acetylmuramate dehydrogenase